MMKNESSDNSSNDYNIIENLWRINILYTTGFCAALALATIMQWITVSIIIRICKTTVSILLYLLERGAISGEYWWSMKYPFPWQREVRGFPPKICLKYLAGKHNFNLVLTGLSFIYFMSHVPSESDRYIF